MSIYRPSPRRRALLALLLLASITVITLDFRSSGSVFRGLRDGTGEVLSPIRKGASAVISPVTRFLSGLAHSGSIRSENDRLRQENADLRSRVDSLEQEAADAKAIKEVLALPLPKDVATVGARVFAPAASTYEFTVEVDAGS